MVRNINLTKTGRDRTIPISDELQKELLAFRSQRMKEWKAKGFAEIPLWVFCNRQGNLLDLQNVKARHFQKCLIICGDYAAVLSKVQTESKMSQKRFAKSAK